MESDPGFEEAVLAFRQGDFDRARTLAEREVAARASPQALHLLGLIECRSGNVTAGVESLRRAWEAEPDNLQFRVMLARSLTDSGQPGQALEVAQPPPGTSPAELALWHARAEAADGAQDWQASAEAWTKLSAARPEDWGAWMRLGEALAALERWPDAAAALRRAAELNPAQPGLRRGLARVLARAGRFQESANELGQWVEASPADVGNRIMFARLLADLGRNAESDAQLQKAAQLAGVPAFGESSDILIAIARGPRADRPGGELDQEIVRELAQLLERTNRMDALQELLDAGSAQGIAPEQLGYPAAAAALRRGDPEEARRLLLCQPPETEPVRWRWLMARILDALDDPAAAFAEAEAMNRAERDYESWRARGRAHRQFVRNLAGTIAPAWARTLKTLPPDERGTPAFLVGFPRSGTTLLDTFLMGHPETAVFEEAPLLDPAQRKLGEMAELPKRSEAELGDARDAYFGALAEYLDPGFSGLVIDKLPLNMIAAPFLHALFPGAPFIFVQRHPCDAVLSCFMQGFALNDSMACFLDIRDAADYYDAATTLWQRSRDALGLNVHTLLYEDLVADPEAMLRPLVAFLGLEWRDGLLDHRATAKARRGIGTPSYNQVTQPLNRAPSGRWKRYARQLDPVLPILLPWAERLGYRD